MSAEKDLNITRLIDQIDDYDEKTRMSILMEIRGIQRIRSNFRINNRSRDIKKKLHESKNLQTILAAELFPDEAPNPQFFAARWVGGVHDDVRTRVEEEFPDLARKPRISGELIILKDKTKFFMCDPISLCNGITQLPTMKNYIEVAEILLAKGFIPTDAEFNIIPTSS
jgi:hypothetical protein